MSCAEAVSVGIEAARHLVLALGAGFEPLQALGDAIVDALVVAGLEMQAVIVAARAPVAPEQGVLADEEDRHRDRRRCRGGRS